VTRVKSSKALRAEMTAGLAQAGRQWQRLVEQAIAGCGLSTAGATALIYIGRADGGLYQVALAETVGVRGPALVRQLDKLCDMGLVRRVIDRDNRRANLLELTDAGRHLADRLEARIAELRRTVFGRLPNRDVEVVLRVHRLLSSACAALAVVGKPESA
jgi:MarR family transcriptional regulator for hemolysin